MTDDAALLLAIRDQPSLDFEVGAEVLTFRGGSGQTYRAVVPLAAIRRVVDALGPGARFVYDEDTLANRVRFLTIELDENADLTMDPIAATIGS